MSANVQILPENLNLQRWQMISLVGALGLIACTVGWLIEPTQFFRSYLTGCIFLIGLALGCLGVLMMQFVAGGRWGLFCVVR